MLGTLLLKGVRGRLVLLVLVELLEMWFLLEMAAVLRVTGNRFLGLEWSAKDMAQTRGCTDSTGAEDELERPSRRRLWQEQERKRCRRAARRAGRSVRSRERRRRE